MPLFSKVSGSCLLAAAFALAAPAAAQPETGTRISDGEEVSSDILVIGAIKDPAGPEAAVREDESVPELPVLYEEEKIEPAKVSAPVDAAPPASPAS